jgi:leucyl aminopeptidase
MLFLQRITPPAFAAVCFAMLPVAAFAIEPRLIQYGPEAHQVEWMEEVQIGLLSEENHQAGRCAGFMDITETREQWAAIEAQPLSKTIADFELASLGFARNAQIERLVEEADPALLTETIERLSTFKTRHARSDTGVEAAQWIAERFRDLAKGRSDIQVDLISHSKFKQPSVRARIQGSGPRASEIVVLGAHEDSINQGDIFGHSGRAPGADDDASGVATVLEVFRVLAQSGVRPDRTIEFITYAGEELGLLGSQAIAIDYKNRKAQVAAVLQFDMTMVPGPSTTLHFITDHTSPQVTDLLRRLTDNYVKVKWGNTQCGYACSDHASWTRAGYASGFPFEASFKEANNRIHTERDLPEATVPDFGGAFAKLGIAYAMEVAGEVGSGR